VYNVAMICIRYYDSDIAQYSVNLMSHYSSFSCVYKRKRQHSNKRHILFQI